MDLLASFLSKMKIIVGLGNPGKEYELTRHNVGFMLLDSFADHLKVDFSVSTNYKAHLAEYNLRNEKIFLLKPLTYMNVSGESLAKLARFYKIAPQDIIIAHDDMDLEVGNVKFKQGGGHSGHNGIKSIFNSFGEQEFYRFRIGIGRPPGQMNPADYVLGAFKDADIEILNSNFEKYIKTLDLWMNGEIGKAQTMINRRS